MRRVRILGGKNRMPIIGRFGLFNSRICPTSTMSISVPSTGVASTHKRVSIPMERSWISTNE